MSIQLNSWFVKDMDPAPYVFNATSRLERFALMKGERCAIINTKLIKTGREQLKILFKKVIINTHVQIEEFIFYEVANFNKAVLAP